MRKICVYCGSSIGSNPAYREAAQELGTLLAHRGLTLIYGGGRIGLMGVLADAALAAGGEVIGVIPGFLALREVAHPGLTRLETTGSMHERKARLLALTDAVIALPGGLGTFDELLETLTWGQLGLHRLPIGALNVAGFFDPFRAQLDRAVADQLLQGVHRDRLLIDTEPGRLLERLATVGIPTVPKSFDRV